MKVHQKGFTLVELAIVLVIVGLLIGGILVAQSMIATTRVQSFVRQMAQFDAAVALFKSKYGAIPGDYSGNAMGGSAAGDGNGDLTSISGFWVGEQSNFWPMLSSAGLKAEGDDVQTYTTSYVLGTGMPRAKIGKNTGVYVAGTLGSTMPILDSTGVGNAYVIIDCTASTNVVMNCSSGVSGNDAIAVDIKMDDGAGDTGNVVGTDYNTVGNWFPVINATETTYTAGTDTGAYGLVIRMGSTTGELY